MRDRTSQLLYRKSGTLVDTTNQDERLYLTNWYSSSREPDEPTHSTLTWISEYRLSKLPLSVAVDTMSYDVEIRRPSFAPL